jgi:hypothetical protein
MIIAIKIMTVIPQANIQHAVIIEKNNIFFRRISFMEVSDVVDAYMRWVNITNLKKY